MGGYLICPGRVCGCTDVAVRPRWKHSGIALVSYRDARRIRSVLDCLYRETHCRSCRNGFRKSRRSYLTKMVLLALIAPFNTSARKISWVGFTFKRYSRDNLSVRLNRRNFIAIKSVCSGRKNQCYFFKCEISMDV